jgi:hypothetical protein
MDTWRGMFKARGDTKNLEALDQLDAAGATEAVEQMLEQNLSNAQVDPTDPDFAPVEGVDVDRYAVICKKIVDAGPQTDEKLALSIVEEHGVDPSKWTQIAEVWNERVMRSHPVKMRYSAVFMGRPPA